MKNQAARDATLLALIAENPDMPAEDLTEILAEIQDPVIKEAARALQADVVADAKSDAGRLAGSVRSWVEHGRARQTLNSARTKHNSRS